MRATMQEAVFKYSKQAKLDNQIIPLVSIIYMTKWETRQVREFKRRNYKKTQVLKEKMQEDSIETAQLKVHQKAKLEAVRSKARNIHNNNQPTQEEITSSNMTKTKLKKFKLAIWAITKMGELREGLKKARCLQFPQWVSNNNQQSKSTKAGSLKVNSKVKMIEKRS